LKENTKYYWKLVPTYATGAATNCPVWSFTTESLGSATDPNPSVGSTGVSTTPQLTWAYSILGKCAPTGYEIYFDTTSNPKLVDKVAGKTYTSKPLHQGRTYYWKVVPYNANGKASGCPVWNFSTLTPCVAYFYPKDGTTCEDINRAMSFERADGVTSVKFYFGTSSDPPFIKTYTADHFIGYATPYVLPPTVLSWDTKYYWKIVPTYRLGDATGCPVWSFTTGQLGCAMNPSPSNGATGVSSNPTFSWAYSGPAGCNPDSYRVNYGPTSAMTYYTYVSGTTYSPGTLILGTTYYWQVTPFISGSGRVTYNCPVWSFTVHN
jgi:hypothetical protein